MQKHPTKRIFISHSWLDRDLIQPFTDAFFPPKPKRAPVTKEYEVIFSSDSNDPEKRLHLGAQIWSELENYLINCSYFLAFASENYFRSQTCQNELGAIAVLQRLLPESKRPLIIPILLEELTDRHGFNQVINKGRNYSWFRDAKSVGDVLEVLKPVFQTEKFEELKKKAEEVAKKIDKAYQKPRTAHNIKNLVLSHFSDRTSTKNPVTYFIKRLEYELISVQLAKCAKHSLVWSVYRSPLLVTSAYREGNKKTHYDKSFEILKLAKKIRLVIFENGIESEAYKTCAVKPHKDKMPSLRLNKSRLQARRRAFEKSSEEGGTLFFTTITALNKFLGIKDDADDKDKLTDKDFLEFGYFDFDDGNLLFNSGFYSGCESEFHKRPEAYYQVNHFTVHRPDLSNEVAELFTREHCHHVFGHLKHLERIAEEVVSPHPNPAFFVGKNQISKLKIL